MSHKSEAITGGSRITLTLSGLWTLVAGVTVCVSTVLGAYFKVTHQLSDMQTVMNGGLITYDDQEKWVLKARAANAVKYPDFVWPNIHDKDSQVSINSPSPVITAAE